ncbi:MAG: hypothetical protein K8E24_006455 [Methanobacterium paludis]|nr:hypothetical protein [Methanobacterium paludis]
MSNEFTYFYSITGDTVLVDTNLLLLLLIGTIDKKYIEIFKRTSKFTENDFDLLVEILKHYDKIITTPNILTETDNFIKNIKNPKYKYQARLKISNWIMGGFIKEELIETKDLCNEDCFFIFGLADAVITTVSGEKIGVLTKDKRLYDDLKDRGVPSINFKDYMEKEN